MAHPDIEWIFPFGSWSPSISSPFQIMIFGKSYLHTRNMIVPIIVLLLDFICSYDIFGQWWNRGLVFLRNMSILNPNSDPMNSTFKYHVFAPMGRFQLELIYLYFPPSSHKIYVRFCPVGLSLLWQHYQQVLWVLKSLQSPGLGSWQSTAQVRRQK